MATYADATLAVPFFSNAEHEGGVVAVMDADHPPLPAELLESQGAWVRRLARALVGDGADDLVQDTWETVLRGPPRHGGAVRGWLRRIVSTRAQNAARSRERRLSRDGVAQAVADSVAPSPEEIAARVEVQRRLAAAVEGLSDAYREVVYLRYFEGREPSEIARRLRLPAGTVRWRIKTALDELRQRLDREERSGETRWIAVLGSVVDEDRRAATIGRGRLGITVGFVTGAALLVVVVGRLAERSARRRGSSPAPAAEELLRSIPPSPGASARLINTAPAACEAAAELRRLVAIRQREVDAYEIPDVLFRRSPTNPAGQKAFGAAYERGMSEVSPRCDYTLECRAAVCQVRLLVPAGSNPRDCFPGRDGSAWVRERLDARVSMLMNIGDPNVVDSASGRHFQRFDVFYRLARLDGAATSGEARKPRAVTSGLLAEHDVPDGVVGECRDEVIRLRGTLLDADARLSELLTPQEAFAVSAPNPSAVPKLSAELARLLGEPAAFRVECRGVVCSVEGTERLPAALANHWQCDAPGPGGSEGCRINEGDGGWYAQLRRAAGGSDFIARVFPPSRREGREERGFVRLRSEKDRGRIDTMKWTCQIVDSVEVASILTDCTRRFPQEHGSLDLTLHIPGPEEPTPRRATLSLRGTLGGSGLGKCLGGELNVFFDGREAPELRNRTTIHRTLVFPGTRSLWGDRSPCGN